QASAPDSATSPAPAPAPAPALAPSTPPSEFPRGSAGGAQAPGGSLAGLRVLIVEGEEAVRGPLAGYLTRRGAGVDGAADGVEGGAVLGVGAGGGGGRGGGGVGEVGGVGRVDGGMRWPAGRPDTMMETVCWSCWSCS